MHGHVTCTSRGLVRGASSGNDGIELRQGHETTAHELCLRGRRFEALLSHLRTLFFHFDTRRAIFSSDLVLGFRRPERGSFYLDFSPADTIPTRRSRVIYRPSSTSIERPTPPVKPSKTGSRAPRSEEGAGRSSQAKTDGPTDTARHKTTR